MPDPKSLISNLRSQVSAPFRREWLLIALLFVIMIVKGVLWSLAFPLWQGPDEDDHYAVIQFIAETGRLPDADNTWLPDEVALSRAIADVGRLDYAPEQRQGWSDTAVGPNESQFDQLPATVRYTYEERIVGKLMKATPFYYVLGAGVYRLFPEGNLLERAFIQRFFAVLISSPLVIVAYLIARLLFPAAAPGHAALRLTVPTLVAFHPMVTEITAVVSVDGFYVVCYSLLIYLTLRLLRRRLTWRLALAIGAVFAVGFLTKPTINGFAPLIALAVAYDWQRGRGRRWEVVRNAALMGAVILLPAAWWMARSLRINNDLFYFNPVLEGHRVIQNPFYDYQPLVHMWHYYQSVWGGIFVSWWGLFGWLDTPLPPWVYHLLRGLTMAAIVGLFALWQRRRESAPSRRQWRARRRMAPVGVWLFLGLTVLVPIVLLQFYDLTFWWEFGNGRGLQGRYWLGTAVPMLAFFALGLLTLLPGRWRPWGHQLLRGGMVLLNLVSLLGYILPRYYL